MEIEIDGIDRKILSHLRENSRARNVEIAKQLGLTEGTVRNRIEKLISDKVISKFTIETYSAESVFGVVMLKARASTKKMMAEVSAAKIHREAFEISGEFDGCVIIESSSLQGLDEKIDRIRKCPSLAETRTFIAVKKW
ncbi:MAG: Lrp/AsnC family transcriptional regulator [Candidatus Micrarchaeota archaeon]